MDEKEFTINSFLAQIKLIKLPNNKEYLKFYIKNNNLWLIIILMM